MKKPLLIALFAALAIVTTFTVGWKLTHQTTSDGSKVLPSATSPASRNAIRREHLNDLGAALNDYMASHPKLPINVTSKDTEICSSVGANCKRLKLHDLSFLLGNNSSLRTIPRDPSGGYGQYNGGYTLAKDPVTGKFRLTAPRTEGGTVIVIYK